MAVEIGEWGFQLPRPEVKGRALQVTSLELDSTVDRWKAVVDGKWVFYHFPEDEEAGLHPAWKMVADFSTTSLVETGWLTEPTREDIDQEDRFVLHGVLARAKALADESLGAGFSGDEARALRWEAALQGWG